MNYLFILLGNDSFYESIMISKLVDEMPVNAGIFCITGQLQTVYFSDNQRILKLQIGNDMSENNKIFNDLIQEGEISAIFIFDFHKYFFKSTRPIIKFDIKWLENLNIPVNLIDYLDMFDYNGMNQLYLKNSINFNIIYKPDNENTDIPSEEELLQKDTLDIQETLEEDEQPKEDFIVKNPFWPNIIRLSPPYPSHENSESNKIFYWKSSAKNYLTNDIEGMKAPLGITEGKKNVLILFSPQMIFQSVLENKQAHYLSVIKIMILYLKKLDIEMNLFLIGFDSYPELTKGTKIKLKSFKLLNHGLYKTLTTYADLIITDTPWHPVLLDAAELKIPACVIGNSLNLLEDGTLESDFESTDPDVFQELEISIDVSPNIFYPYIAFPLKNDSPPEFTFFDEKFMYYLLDIYYDEVFISFLREFLIIDEDVSENLKIVQEVYNERSEDAMDTEALLLRIQGAGNNGGQLI